MPVQLSLEDEYGPGAEQICPECCYSGSCYFHKNNAKIVGCTHYYKKTNTNNKEEK